MPNPPTRADLTPEEREGIYRLGRMGASLTGMAHSLGLTRDEFRSLRARHPDFDAGIMRALFEYELGLLMEATTGEDAQRAFATKELARRFPQRHGADPKLRTDKDERIQDDSQDAGRTAEPVAFEQAVEALLEAKKAGKL